MCSKQNSLNLMTEDIVISGISGRFPESDSTDDFANNLYNNVDMITEESRRWPKDLYGMCPRMGQLKHIDRFDSRFFGIMDKFGDNIDPQSRILLETTYEAIIDAGINPQSLRGTKTGVYIGVSTFAMPEGIPEETHPDSENAISQSVLWLHGCGLCLQSNRISFVFDFRGPSLVIDTACSSSLVGLNVAINDLRLGKCEQAIVGGAHINLLPFTNHIFQATHLNASDGIPKVWDEKADGYVRGEAVACYLLQRRSVAKRIYATVLNAGVNIDGNKRMGMFYPSAESQEQLLVSTYQEANVDPHKINYFEAHATGTKAGDPQEAKAIYNAYFKQTNKEGILPIGLSKGIIGHTEGASGISSMIKVLIAFENQCISANRNLNKIKSAIAEMCPPLFPVRDNYKYTPGIAGVANFGIGGVNGHVLLEPNYNVEDEDNLKIADTIPRIVNICCRTEEAFNQMCKWIEDNPQKVTRHFLALLTETMKYSPVIKSVGFPIRGSLIIKKKTNFNDNFTYEYKRRYSVFVEKAVRPLWLLFPGLGGQWTGMAKALMPIDIFANKIEECHQILRPYSIDLKHLLLSEDSDSMSTMTNKFCATTALEIALFDVIKALNLTPDGIIGHSFGEIACAYADGCLTTEEAILISFKRGIITENDKRIPKGLMAVIGMSWNEAKQLCPKGVSVVCNNAKNTVVVSGLLKETKEFVNKLSEKEVFVHEIQSSDIAYHSEYLLCCSEDMTNEIKKHLSNPRKRSDKWITTSIIDSNPDEELLLASAEYFVNNLISPVYFYDKLKTLPSDAIVVELGPHKLFSKIVTQTLESSTYLSLIKKDSNDTNLDMFLDSIAKLYELGLNPSIENLYPRVEFPVVRGTQSVSSLMKWDHQKSYFVRKYPEFKFRATASDLNETIDIGNAIKNYLPDHKIDGKILFPASGYLMLAWRRMASNFARIWNQISVVFEDIQFRRPVFLSETEVTKLRVRYHENSGDFVILEHNNVVCLGKVWPSDDNSLYAQDMINEDICGENEVYLSANDIYKELRVRGYDYGPEFRNLKHIHTKDFNTFHGSVEWKGNWITFMDSLFQTMAVAVPFRKLMVPVMIRKLRCDPNVLYGGVTQNKCMDEEREKCDQDSKVDVWDEGKIDELDGETDILQSDEVKTKYLDEIMYSKFHNYRSALPFQVNMNSRLIVTHGIEVEDMIALPIPRISNLNDLILDSYQFIANEDMNAIEKSDCNQLLDYLQICSSLAKRVRHFYTNDNSNEDFDQHLERDSINMFNTNLNENQIMLKILLKLNDCLIDGNHNLNVDSVKEKIDKLMIEFSKNPEFDLSKDVINEIQKNEYLIRSLLDIVSENNVPKKDLKVLEINLTNNLLAKEVDNHLASAAIYPIDVNYTIAVKSIDFIPEDYKQMSFKLNEWNTESSCFPSDILALNLIIMRDSHDLWHLNLNSFVQEIYDSLLDRGFLLCVFRYKYTEPEMAINSMNGRNHLDNTELEKRSIDFLETAKRIGFRFVGYKSDTISHKTYLFKKVEQNIIPLEDSLIGVRIESYDWFETLKEKMKKSKEDNIEDQNIWLIANDSKVNGIIGLINCLRLEPGGETIKCIFDCDNRIQTPINFNVYPFNDIFSNCLAVNVIKNGKLGTFRHLTLPKNYDKKESNEYFLNCGHHSDLSIVQWVDSTNIAPTSELYDINNKKNTKIHCDIYCSGLNFKDVMFATGRIVSGPMSLFTDCVIGIEFAGRRTDTGQRVMGFDLSRCFATSIDAMENFITPIPEHWSMEDSVTILVVYSTVWYGLIERAHLQRDESILIHSGAGGVGQAAINICKYYNCNIYVTVGNDEKKKFLMTEYNIPENRIFSSRDIQFKYKIKSLTDGKGVDLVLNSLTGDKLEASYECVADCGRFVEIGKYDLQMNKQMGMFSFLRDISFIGVAMDQKLFLKEDFIQKFYNWMNDNSNNGMIKPINRSVFKAEEAEKAFRYMTSGKHIGKIVIKIRDEESDRNPINFIKPAISLKTITKTYFNPNKIYIITGGLGGFGLELVHWMLFLGARKFMLTSRHGITTDYQRFLLKRLHFLSEKFKMFSTKIEVFVQKDNSEQSIQELIVQSLNMGPIGGVFHLVLVLNDCLLENQTIDKFNETVDSKTKTFMNLDNISRKLNLNFDYFVVFSSVACGKGNAGQSGYGFANSVCERICEARRNDGLNGLAIQWGPIGDVGAFADMEIPSFFSISKQRINSCLDILDKLLQIPYPIVSCLMRAERQIKSGTREERIVAQIWQALGIDPKTTPNHLTLGEIGMESMFAVELQQGLERDYDIKVTLNDVKNITVGMMKDFESGKVDEMRGYAEEAKKARAKLLKIKFIIPSEAYTKLNRVKSGKPIYFLPPLEGIFASFEALAEKINRPVIGLNWTKEVQDLKSVKMIYLYFKGLLESLSPNESYDLLGTLDNGGVFIIKLLQKASVKSALIIDTISDCISDNTIITDEYLLETSVQTFSKTLPKPAQEKLWREIRSKTDIDSKINKLSTDIIDFVGKGLIGKDMDDILRNSYKRLKLITEYLNQKRRKYSKLSKSNLIAKYHPLNGSLFIVKLFESNNEMKDHKSLENRIKDYYFIGDNKFNLEVIEENPNDFGSDKIVECVNNYFN